MFSRRLRWPYSPNRLSRLLEEKRRRGAAVLDLTESNPTRVGLPYPSDALAAALADPGTALYDPAPRGLATARSSVAADQAARGRPVDPERIVLTASTSEAYSILFKLLADPGDAVLVPRPSYPLFDYLAALDGLRVETYALAYDERWSIDFESLERALDACGQRSRAIVLVNPNNPTGSALRRGELGRLREIGARRGAALISDEVFVDYLDATAAAEEAMRALDPIVSAHDLEPAGSTGPPRSQPLTFVLGGLSKTCGLPQMKLGWIIVDGPGDLTGEAIERLDLIADTYLSVSTPVMRAAGRLLGLGAEIRAAIRHRVEGNLRRLLERTEASSCRALQRDGGWYAVLQIPAIVAEEDRVLALLSEDDVLVHPGYFFDFPREAYLVLSLLPRPDLFDEALRRVLARTQR